MDGKGNRDGDRDVVENGNEVGNLGTGRGRSVQERQRGKRGSLRVVPCMRECVRAACVRLSKRGWMDRLARGGTKYTKYSGGLGGKGEARRWLATRAWIC